MEALILAAGKGTRLRPLSLKKPKPLFPVCNLPLVGLTLDRLRGCSVRRMILNTHYLAEQIRDFIKDYQSADPGLELSTRHEPEILGTGGGLKNTEDFWTADPFLVINGDIAWDFDLIPVLDFHRRHGGPVTLVLQEAPAFNNMRLAADGTVQKFRIPDGDRAFTGIHVLSREIFSFLPPRGSYDIIPVYQGMIGRGVPIRTYVVRDHYWRDLGTPASYRELHREILSGQGISRGDCSVLQTGSGSRWCIHPQAEVEPETRLLGWGAIGEGTRIAAGCTLRNAIIWKRVLVQKGVTVEDSIVADGIKVEIDIINKIIG